MAVIKGKGGWNSVRNVVLDQLNVGAKVIVVVFLGCLLFRWSNEVIIARKDPHWIA